MALRAPGITWFLGDGWDINGGELRTARLLDIGLPGRMMRVDMHDMTNILGRVLRCDQQILEVANNEAPIRHGFSVLFFLLLSSESRFSRFRQYFQRSATGGGFEVLQPCSSLSQSKVRQERSEVKLIAPEREKAVLQVLLAPHFLTFTRRHCSTNCVR